MFKRAGAASEEGRMPSENEAEIFCLPLIIPFLSRHGDCLNKKQTIKPDRGKEVKMMKKTIVLAVALVVSVTATAMAFGPGYGMGMTGANLTPEQTQKHTQFQKDILPLKQKMLQLKTEIMTLRTAATPDWNAIAAKQKEMVDVRTEIQKKAAEAGISGFGPGLCKGGKGMGMGMSKMGRMGI